MIYSYSGAFTDGPYGYLLLTCPLYYTFCCVSKHLLSVPKSFGSLRLTFPIIRNPLIFPLAGVPQPSSSDEK